MSFSTADTPSGARARPRALTALLLASLTVGGGCIEPIELVGDDPGEDAGVDGGGSCVTSADCPTGRCVDGACEPGALCASEDEACDVDADCCNASCDSGRCAALGQCLVVGERCGAGHACCSGACAPDEDDDEGGGERRCLALGGCLPAGELCRDDAECCNTLATDACRIFDAARGLGRCATPVECLPAGELCQSDGPELRCCDERSGVGEELDCEDTRVADDVHRCVSERSRRECFPAEATCATPDECCSGRCDSLRCAAGG